MTTSWKVAQLWQTECDAWFNFFQKKTNFFCLGDNASKINFLSSRFAWGLETTRESTLSSILWEKNCKIFPIQGYLPPKPTFCAMYQWVSSHQPTDELMSFWIKVTILSNSPRAEHVPFSGDFSCTSYHFWVTDNQSIPKIWLEHIVQFAISAGLVHRESEACNWQPCTTIMYGQRNTPTKIHYGVSVDWLWILFCCRLLHTLRS